MFAGRTPVHAAAGLDAEARGADSIRNSSVVDFIRSYVYLYIYIYIHIERDVVIYVRVYVCMSVCKYYCCYALLMFRSFHHD